MTSLNRRQFNTLIAAGVSTFAAPYVARAQALDTVRFCWTPTVSVSGQLQHALLRTDIAERNGLKLEASMLTSTSAVNEALASNASEIGSVSDFGSVLMMAANAPLQTVAHQSIFRSAVLATKKSGIKSMADLKGKQVYGLFGITAYLNAQEAVRAAGLKVGSDVTFINIGTAELADAVRAQKIDAFFIWDPWVALFEQADLGTVLSQNLTPAMVLEARNDMVTKRPDVLRRFLLSHAQALYFASQNHDLTNKWFRSVEAAKAMPEDVIEKSSLFDPHWSAKKPSDILSAMSEKGVANIQHQADWGFSEKLLPRATKVANFVNTEIAKTVDAEMKTNVFDVAKVKVVKA